MSENTNPMDEVVGRVRNRVAPDGRAWLPCDLDGNPIPEVRYDLTKLLAAYQSALEELAHQKQVAEDAEVRAMVAAYQSVREYIWQSGALWASMHPKVDVLEIRANNPFRTGGTE